jgi:hypothetical protein
MNAHVLRCVRISEIWTRIWRLAWVWAWARRWEHLSSYPVSFGSLEVGAWLWLSCYVSSLVSFGFLNIWVIWPRLPVYSLLLAFLISLVLLFCYSVFFAILVYPVLRFIFFKLNAFVPYLRYLYSRFTED